MAKWSVALATAARWPGGSFLDAYASNRAEQVRAFVAADYVSSHLLDFMEARTEWIGTPTDLYDRLTDLASDTTKRREEGSQRPCQQGTTGVDFVTWSRCGTGRQGIDSGVGNNNSQTPYRSRANNSASFVALKTKRRKGYPNVCQKRSCNSNIANVAHRFFKRAQKACVQATAFV